MNLFVLIRDKLGDTLIAFNVLRAFRELHPESQITVMVHAHYLPLLEHEQGYRLVPYRSALAAYAWAVGQRLLGRHFDAVVVLRGFGAKIARLAKLLPTTRRIHAFGRFPAIFNCPVPNPREDDLHPTPALRALQVLDPSLCLPQTLHLPGLASLRANAEHVVICPVSDEPRRTMSTDDVAGILPALAQRHPGLPIHVLVRRAEEFTPPPGVTLVAFENINMLLAKLASAAAYYGADTGLFHVAAAMGIPTTVFFGPSQPHKVILPQQNAVSVRLSKLGNRHCDEKRCISPACIELAVSSWAGEASALRSHPPDSCPLHEGGITSDTEVTISPQCGNA
ncbi:glycosyltransferase family 9 protein [Chitiniphilus shinanonensis]|uniref:glycosyltransferase family 9 protein n=1 Tax=Chitiniphilus shinanonensis TaxID=553088 RepID=UPI00302BE31C